MLYPICCAYMLSVTEKEIVFRTFSGKVFRFKSNINLILALFQKSAGNIPVDEIVRAVSKETGTSIPVVRDAVDDLVACDILIDSHNQFLLFHSLTENPPRYPSALSFSDIEELTQSRPNYIVQTPIAAYRDTDSIEIPFFKTLRRRHSCRNFLDKPVEAEKLFAICKASYGDLLGPVASAGALFPLSVYVICRIATGQLPVGLYQYDPQTGLLLLLSTDFIPEAVQYLLDDADFIFGAPYIFFVSGDLGRHMSKYANRGYRYTLLEAGHAVQNMTIAAAELGLGGVEYGGFCDEAVKRLFQMPNSVFPLACYAVGYENPIEKWTERFQHREREKYVIERIARNEELNINPYLINNEQFRLSNLQVMVSEVQEIYGHVEFGTGVATTCGEAYVKSIMEAYERYILSCRYCDLVECADKLGGKYLDPCEYAPYSDIQIKKNCLEKFQTGKPLEWLQGCDLNGNCVYIPADLCFDAAEPGRVPYHVANTSGCAAHFDFEIAKQAALLELIERDAIIKNWAYRQTPPRLSEKNMPDHIKQRMRRYQENGTSLFVLLLPCEYAYVILVCSVNDSGPPYFVSGAAASFCSTVEALTKAFNEWEVSFVLGESERDLNIITPAEVISPRDHGTLYRRANHNDQIDYLLHGPQIETQNIQISHGNTQALTPIYLTYRSIVDGVYVVRAFSKELVPINFGYGMDFFNHPKIDKQLLKDIGFPHFFA